MKLSRGLSLGIPKAVLGLVMHIKKMHQAGLLRSLFSVQGFHRKAISAQLGLPCFRIFNSFASFPDVFWEIHAGFF